MCTSGTISPNGYLIFPQKFLDLRLDPIEKQRIINLSSYNSKIYASVILGDFEVTFFGEGENATCLPCLLCSFYFLHPTLHIQRSKIYASVILGDFEVSFLGEGENATCLPCLLCSFYFLHPTLHFQRSMQ